MKTFEEHYYDVVKESRRGDHIFKWHDGCVYHYSKIRRVGLIDDSEFWISIKNHAIYQIRFYQKRHVLKIIKYSFERIENNMNYCEQWYLKWLANERCEHERIQRPLQGYNYWSPKM